MLPRINGKTFSEHSRVLVNFIADFLYFCTRKGLGGDTAQKIVGLFYVFNIFSRFCHRLFWNRVRGVNTEN